MQIQSCAAARSNDLVLIQLDSVFYDFFRGDSAGPVHGPCDVQLLGTCVLGMCILGMCVLGTCVLTKVWVGAYLIIVNQTSGKST